MQPHKLAVTNNSLAADAIMTKLRQIFPRAGQRILLIEPPNVPEEDWDSEVASDNRYPVYEPYGLGILSSCIELRGYTVSIIDLNFRLQEEFKKRPENFRYKIWEDWLADELVRFNPNVVGITCMFTIYHRSMVRVAKLVKKINPNILTIAGGVHTTMASTDVITAPGQLVLEDCHEIDFVGLNEGNDSFADFLDVANGLASKDRLTQIATLIDGNYVAISQRAEPHPETLNIAPSYHDLPIEKYSSLGRIGTFYWLFKSGTRAGTILINRGCRAKCRFCSVEKFNGVGVVLKREINVVLDQLERMRDKYGINHVMLLDDDIFNGEERTVALFSGWAKRNLNITWDASNGVIASALTDEIAHAAAESGCIALSFGIESGNPEVLRNIPKPSGVRHYLRAGEIMKNYPGIFTKGLLMVGFPPEPERNFPGESIGMIWDTINLAKQMDLDWYTIQPLNLIPGVEITNHAISRGEIDKRVFLDGTERPIVGSTGRQTKRYQREKETAPPFVNHLIGDKNIIPRREDLVDVWFAMDYLVNYEKLWDLKIPIKTEMLHKMFGTLFDHTHKDNALGNLFFSLIELKMGNLGEASRRLNLARQYSQSNAYWRARFSTIGLDKVLRQIESQIHVQ